MKIKEAIAMLNEFAKVCGDGGEVNIHEMALKGSIGESYLAGAFYRAPEVGPKYYVSVNDSQRTAEVSEEVARQLQEFREIQ